MKKIRDRDKIFFLLILVIIAFGAYYQFKPSESIQNVVTVRSGIQTGRFLNSYLPMYIAENAGFFKEQGLNVTLLPLGGQSTAKALLSHNEEFDSGFETEILAKTGGSDAKLVMVYAGNENFLYSNFTSVQDFKGKKIALGCTGCLSYMNTVKLLQNNGLNASDVQIINMPDTNQRILALKSGQVAAAAAPYSSFKDNEIKLGIYLSNDSQTSLSGAIVTSEKFMNEHPDVVMRFTTAIAETVNYIYTNKPGTISLIESGMQVDNTTANQVYDFIIAHKFYQASLNLTNINGEIQDVTTFSGKQPFSANDFVNTTFFDNLPNNLKT